MEPWARGGSGSAGEKLLYGLKYTALEYRLSEAKILESTRHPRLERVDDG